MKDMLASYAAKRKAEQLTSSISAASSSSSASLQVKHHKSGGGGSISAAAPREPPPDFLILGAQKAGTKACVTNLNKRPDIYVWGEPHFFDLGWHTRTVESYCKHFSVMGAGKRLRGEKTPELIYVDDCAPRIKQVCPEAKFILFLREPIKRAYSGWNMNVKRRIEELPFDAACKRNFDNLGEFRSHGTAEYHYVQRGFYMDQIERFLKIFPDRSKLHIVIAERVRANMKVEYGKILAFIGADVNAPLVLEDDHVGSYTKPMSDTVREKLRRIYTPHNERLYDFLGFRIPEWEEEKVEGKTRGETAAAEGVGGAVGAAADKSMEAEVSAKPG